MERRTRGTKIRTVPCCAPSCRRDRAHLPLQTRIPDQACSRTRVLQSGIDLVRKPRPFTLSQIFISSSAPRGHFGLHRNPVTTSRRKYVPQAGERSCDIIRPSKRGEHNATEFPIVSAGRLSGVWSGTIRALDQPPAAGQSSHVSDDSYVQRDREREHTSFIPMEQERSANPQRHVCELHDASDGMGNKWSQLHGHGEQQFRQCHQYACHFDCVPNPRR